MTYMEALLKDKSAPDGHSTAYIGFSSDNYDIYRGSPERRKRS